MHLLEQRMTGFRLSPLLMTLAFCKTPHIVHNLTGTVVQNYVETARVLLKYGARPDAKDVSGKNATHFGAGSKANSDSLEIAKNVY